MAVPVLVPVPVPVLLTSPSLLPFPSPLFVLLPFFSFFLFFHLAQDEESPPPLLPAMMVDAMGEITAVAGRNGRVAGESCGCGIVLSMT